MTGTAWQRLSGLDAYRVTQIPALARRTTRSGPGRPGHPARPARRRADGRLPRRDQPRGPARPGRRRLGAHRTGQPGARPNRRIRPARQRQCRPAPRQRPAAPAAPHGSADRPALPGSAALGTGEVPLALPAGARGMSSPAGGLAAAMTGLPCWTMIAGIADGLLAEEAGPAPPRPVSLDEGLLAAWHGAFGWLVLADPLTPPEAGKLAAEVADRQRLTAGLAERDPDKAVDSRGASPSGTPNCGAAGRLGCGGCTCWPARPTRKRPRGWPGCSAPPRIPAACPTRWPLPAAGRNQPARTARRAQPGDPGQPRTARPPRSRSTAAPRCSPRWPGCRRPRCPASGWCSARNSTSPWSRPRPRVLPAPARAAAGHRAGPQRQSRPGTSLVPAGVAEPARRSSAARPAPASRRPCGPCWRPRQRRGSALAGRRAGQGRVPADGRSAGWACRRGGADPARRGGSGRGRDQPAAARGRRRTGRRFPLQTHADLVRALFLASFAADEPFPQVLSAAVTRVYEQAGWDLALGEPATPGVQPRLPHAG